MVLFLLFLDKTRTHCCKYSLLFHKFSDVDGRASFRHGDFVFGRPAQTAGKADVSRNLVLLRNFL